MKKYFISNGNTLSVSKSNKRETRAQKIKITNPLTIERYVLVSNYFYTHVSRLLDFDTDDVVSFDIKYFFIL